MAEGTDRRSCFYIPELPRPDKETAIAESGNGNPLLRSVMQRRFSALMGIPVRAAVFDVDNNLTCGSSKRIAEQALALITLLRTYDVPVMLNSGRRYKNPDTGRFDEMDLKTVVLDLHKYIAKSLELSARRDHILSGLFIAAESGLDLTNGFLETEEGKWRSFEARMFDAAGTTRNVAREKELRSFLRGLNLDAYADLFGERLEKKYFYTFRGTRKGMEALRGILIEKLMGAGLWDPQTMKIVVGGVGLDISFYPMDKSSSFIFFDKVLGLRDDKEGVIVSFGDSGERGGNDYPMLAGRKGGLATDQYDPDDECMIALPLISGHEPGLPSVLWAMRQFKYRAEAAAGE